ncbi:MAG: metallophosphoesterase [Ancalomicrobiaceae bacterium]|nr:metallophosphoesterase [Ancalomicrobiaceae bacterium]
MFRLAHLSDPHLGPMPPAALADLASKRALGYLNWHLNRGRGKIDADALDRIVADVRAQAPDHVAVTGDLVNIALASEIDRAAHWLAGLGNARDVSLVPGNHDAYVPGALARAGNRWAQFLKGDGPGLMGDAPAGRAFPYLRRRQDVAIIGTSSAVATGPFMATGRFDAHQALLLEQMLVHAGRDGLCRVVLIHHPPVRGATGWPARLIGQARFQAAIAAAGAELVLHGHTHRSSLNWIAGRDRPVPVVGVPSAAASPTLDKRGGGWNLIEIDGEPGDWRISRIERGFAAGAQSPHEIARACLVPPARVPA